MAELSGLTRRSRVGASVLLASLGALALHCSTTPASPSGPQPLATCSSDAECSALKLTCDLTRHECVCTSDSECSTISSATPYCNVFTGRCVATVSGCTTGSCPSGQYCDEGIRTCEPILGYCAQCTDDNQCGENNYCVANPQFPDSATFCAAACSSTGTCPAGQTCSATSAGVKQCVPTDAICGSIPLCIPDSLTPCSTGTPCADSSQTCNMTLMECVAVNSDCAPGQVCDPTTLACVQPCGETPGVNGNTECQDRYGSPDGGSSGPAFVCINNVCRQSQSCTSDSECSNSQFCATDPTQPAGTPGFCEPSCTSNSDCPLGELCQTDPATQRVGCVSGCMTNADCPLTAVCEDGQCHGAYTDGGVQIDRCQIDNVCQFAQKCINNTCTPEPDNCANPANGCPSGTDQEQVGFIQCGACPAGTTDYPLTNDPSMYGIDCASSGTYECLFQRCLTFCATTADCPKGFNCTSVSGMAQSLCFPFTGAEACL